MASSSKYCSILFHGIGKLSCMECNFHCITRHVIIIFKYIFIIRFSSGKILQEVQIFLKNIICHSIKAPTVCTMFSWELSEDTEERNIQGGVRIEGLL